MYSWTHTVAICSGGSHDKCSVTLRQTVIAPYQNTHSFNLLWNVPNHVEGYCIREQLFKRECDFSAGFRAWVSIRSSFRFLLIATSEQASSSPGCYRPPTCPVHSSVTQGVVVCLFAFYLTVVENSPIFVDGRVWRCHWNSGTSPSSSSFVNISFKSCHLQVNFTVLTLTLCTFKSFECPFTFHTCCQALRGGIYKLDRKTRNLSPSDGFVSWMRDRTAHLQVILFFHYLLIVDTSVVI